MLPSTSSDLSYQAWFCTGHHDALMVPVLMGRLQQIVYHVRCSAQAAINDQTGGHAR